MHLLTAIGILLGCLTRIMSQFWKKCPNWLAIMLYIAALVLMMVGFILAKKNGNQ